jgi:Crp-like helix-turn-helix domain
MLRLALGRSALVAPAVARDLCDSEGLPSTQEFLAQIIGARRNAVSIVAHAFQQAGIVSHSRGHIEITDSDGLLKTSCECYGEAQRQCGAARAITGN